MPDDFELAIHIPDIVHPGEGGNVSFSAGCEPLGAYLFQPGRGDPNYKDGSIIFNLADGTEALRLDGDGSAYVRGEKVDASSREVYDAFRKWVCVATGLYLRDLNPLLKSIYLAGFEATGREWGEEWEGARDEDIRRILYP